MFSEVIILFDQYVASPTTAQQPSFNVDLAAEVQERLRQLDLIVAKVRSLEEAGAAHQRQFAAKLWTHGEIPESVGVSAPREMSAEITSLLTANRTHMVDSTREIRLLTEAFYYFAFRVSQILTHHSKPLPGLSTFECVEMRDVRNHLIEHPERNSKLYAQSFVYGQVAGPALKTGDLGKIGEHFRDAGLYVNANTFQQNFVRVLRRAIEQQNAMPDA